MHWRRPLLGYFQNEIENKKTSIFSPNRRRMTHSPKLRRQFYAISWWLKYMLDFVHINDLARSRF